MNEVAERLSQFFLVQTLVNLCFGLFIGIGLDFIWSVRKNLFCP